MAIEEQATWRTADLCDANEALFDNKTLAVIAENFRSYGGIKCFQGPVSTIRCIEDTSRIHEAVREPGRGRVLFTDGGYSQAKVILGGSPVRLAAENQWSGIVGLGFIRDVDEVKAQNIGVFALGSVPRRSDRKKNSGERDVALNLHETIVSPGDWLYADADGVLVSKHELQAVSPAVECK